VGVEVLGCRDEVVKGVLFVGAAARLVPVLAVFAAAAEVGDRPDTAAFGPEGGEGGEGGLERDAEASVACEQGGALAIEDEVVAMEEEHAHGGAVAGVEFDLLEG